MRRLLGGIEKKFIIASFLFMLAVFVAGGFFLHDQVSRWAMESFIEQNTILAQGIASSIDGDVHRTFTSYEATANPEYRRLLAYFSTLMKKNSSITYLYSVNYIPSEGLFRYAIDGEINDVDTIWLESQLFAFRIRPDGAGGIIVQNQQKDYVSDFSLTLANGKETKATLIKDAATGDISFSVDGTVLVVFKIKTGFSAIVGGQELLHAVRQQTLRVVLTGNQVEVLCSITFAGESGSDPGLLYSESQEELEKEKKRYFSNSEGMIDTGDTGVYGVSKMFTGIIRTKTGEPVGFVGVDVVSKDVDRLQRELFKILGHALLLSLLVMVFGVVLLTRMMIKKPIIAISKAMDDFSGGVLSARAVIRTGDEFEHLGRGFNVMADMISEKTDAMKEAHRKLEVLDKAKSDFINLISHELRTPINTMMTVLQLVDHTKDEKKAHDYYQFVRLAAERLHRLSEAVLSITELKLSDAMVFSAVDIENLVRIGVGALQPTISERRLAINIMCDSNVPKVRGDLELLRQCMAIVVGNAVRFADQGSDVLIHVGISSEHQVQVDIASHGSEFPEEIFDRMFDLFSCTDVEHHSDGLGLGLATAKLIMDVHGGIIRAQNLESGHGSIVKLMFPAA